MAIKIGRGNIYKNSADGGIAANSLDLSDGAHFLTASGGFITKATADSDILGVSLTEKLYTSDNQTVAKKEVDFTPKNADIDYIVDIDGGTVTKADEFKYFKLKDSNSIDGTTVGTTPDDVKLIEFISATKGIFRIV